MRKVRSAGAIRRELGATRRAMADGRVTYQDRVWFAAGICMALDWVMYNGDTSLVGWLKEHKRA